MMILNDREKAALKRLLKMLAMAVLPVVIASLQAESFDLRAFLLAVAIAMLAAIQKYYGWKAARRATR